MVNVVLDETVTKKYSRKLLITCKFSWNIFIILQVALNAKYYF